MAVKEIEKTDNKIDSSPMEYKNIEHKQIHFEIKQFEDEDPNFFTFEGLASTFGNIDRGKDIIERGAFSDTIKTFMPKLLWQHRMSEPLGVFTEIRETEQGLFVKGKMPKVDDLVRGRVIPQMQIGSIDSMSIGFSILEEDIKRTDDQIIRIIKKVNLFEISLVTIPMNALAVVTGMKSIKPFDSLSLSENRDEWVISDAIKAVAAIKGARGGIELDESKKDKVINDLSVFFKSKELSNPFEKGFSPIIEEFGSLTDISSLIKAYGFSNNESNSLISAIKKLSDKTEIDQKELDAAKNLTKSIKEMTGMFES